MRLGEEGRRGRGSGAGGRVRARWRVVERQEARLTSTSSREKMSVQLATAEELALKILWIQNPFLGRLTEPTVR